MTGAVPLGPGPSEMAPTVPEGPSRESPWELLRNRRFLLLETSGSLAGAGYAVYSVSVLFLAYGISGNLLVAGAVLFLEYGIYTGTFLIAPLVDRAKEKRTILLLCYPLQAAAAGALALGLHDHDLSVVELLGLVAVLAVLWDFVWAVYMISPKILLPQRQLLLASGLSNVFSIGTQIGGYAGGGALLFLVGPSGGALAYTVLLLAAAIPAVAVSLRVDAAPTAPFLETFREGWAAFRGRAGRSLRALAGLEMVYGFFAAVPILLIPALAYQRFPQPAEVYGALVTTYALGGAIGGLVLGHINPRRAVGVVLVGASLGGGALVVLLDLTPFSLLAIGALLAGIGAGGTIRYSAKYAWLQASYPAEMLGRLVSNLYFFTGVASSIAVLAVGLASERLSLDSLVLLDGVGLLLAGCLALAIPSVRRLGF